MTDKKQPEALRSIQRFEVVDCIDDKHVPAVIPKPHGPWVRYEDHIAALAAGQATAAPAQPAAQQPQGVAYAALPEPYCNAHDDADACYPDMFSEHQMHAFADATHTLRASRGQAPAGATLPDGWVPLTITHEGQYPEEVAYGPQIMMARLGKWLGKYFAQAAQAADSVTAPAPPPECETEAEKRAFAFGWFKALESERMKAESVLADADRRAGAAERELAECKADVARLEQVRDKMKYQWGVDRRVSFDVVWAEALALKAGTKSDSVQEDAARWNAWSQAMVEGANCDTEPEFLRVLSGAIGDAEPPITLQQLNAWIDAARAAQKEKP